MSRRYKKSEELLERALQSIPLASQTFSKSLTQYPPGISPLFIERGKGSHVWDVDQNEYIDFVSALLAVSIGYSDQDVNAAVSRQLKNGVSFSLPHALEMEVAELIIDMVPCAEMVRFGKNGSDATSAAIRTARAFTGRDHVLVCGYHGWHDWYIGSTTRNLGVPEAVRDLTHTFTYNDIDSLEALFEQYPNQVAAVIMEPMNIAWPEEGFLQAVKELTHSQGALLIFDETITGFRFSAGGAQEYFGVTPDLATLGKGMANGFPLSALAGRKDLLMKMEDIFVSGTFGGETLSLAAAKTVMEKIRDTDVLEHINRIGKRVLDEVPLLIEKHSAESLFSIKGHPCWSFLVISDAEHYNQWEIKTFMLQELFQRGILTIGTHNLNYSHTDLDIDQLLKAYDEVFSLTMQSIADKTLVEKTRAETLVPVFRVR